MTSHIKSYWVKHDVIWSRHTKPDQFTIERECLRGTVSLSCDSCQSHMKALRHFCRINTPGRRSRRLPQPSTFLLRPCPSLPFSHQRRKKMNEARTSFRSVTCWLVLHLATSMLCYERKEEWRPTLVFSSDQKNDLDDGRRKGRDWRTQMHPFRPVVDLYTWWSLRIKYQRLIA